MSNYHVEFESLYIGSFRMSSNCNSICDSLEALEKDIKGFNSWNDIFVGMSADALKSYFENIHFPILQGIMLLSSTHLQLFMEYMSDYCFTVDGSSSSPDGGGDKRAIFDSRELETLAFKYRGYANKTQNTEDDLSQVLREIADLFSCSRTNNEPMLQNYHNKTIQFINEVHDNIDKVESAHVNADFVETSQMITSLTGLIQDVLYKQRDFKANFSEESLMEIKDSYNKFGEKFQALYDKYQTIDQTKLQALEEVSSRYIQEYKDEEEERKRREREANKWRWIGIGAGVVIGVGAIIVTGGAATPAVAAVTGALIGGASAFCNEVADNIIENGSEFGGMNWGHMITRVGVEAGIGAIAGWAGGTAAQKVGDIGLINNFTKSGNFFTKSLGNAAINSSKEVAKGAVKRFATNIGDSVLEGKVPDLVSAVSDGVNLKEAGKDLVKGTTSGIMKSAVSYVKTDEMHRIPRMIAEGTKGGIEDGVTGAVTRGFGEFVDEGYSNKVWRKVFDVENQGREVFKDVVGGAANGAAKEYVQVREVDINDKNVEKYQTDDIQDPKKWTENGGTIRRTVTGRVIYQEKQVYYTPKSKVGEVHYVKGQEVHRDNIRTDTVNVYGGHFRRTPVTP